MVWKRLKIQRLENDFWVDIDFEDLKAGDIFKSADGPLAGKKYVVEQGPMDHNDLPILTHGDPGYPDPVEPLLGVIVRPYEPEDK